MSPVVAGDPLLARTAATIALPCLTAPAIT
jgi:hypothetical protein